MGHCLIYSTHNYTFAIENRLKKMKLNITIAESEEVFDKYISDSHYDLIIFDTSEFDNISKLAERSRSGINCNSSILYLLPKKIDFNNTFKKLHLAPTVGLSKPFSPKELENIVKILIERKQQLDHLINSKEEIEQFSVMAAHDLKVPLKNIFSYADLLKDTLDEENIDKEELKDYANTIFQETQKAIQFVNDMFDFSVAGNAELEIKEFNLHRTIFEIYQVIANKHKDIQHEIILTDIPEIFHGDEVKYTHIFQNLIENSFKYSNNNKLKIEVSYKETFSHEFEIQFSDNGRGIPPEYIEKVFLPFRRAHANIKGTGIGLSIVKKLVEATFGNIEIVQSKVDHGTTFKFTGRLFKQEVKKDEAS